MPYYKCPSCKAKGELRRSNYLDTIQCLDCGKILSIKISDSIVQNVISLEIMINLHDSVPKDIIDDFNEAQICFNVEAYKATVIMCRRVMEILANHKEATGSNLYEKILFLKNEGHIDEATYNLATGVRQFGNYGAHPQDDILKFVDRGVADLVIKTVERVIKSIWS